MVHVIGPVAINPAMLPCMSFSMIDSPGSEAARPGGEMFARLMPQQDLAEAETTNPCKDTLFAGR
jgi:hypothetical protein